MPTKVCIVKATVFPVLMYWCESCTLKKAECWRIDAFKLWCWRRLSRVPWTARRSTQSILKEINPEYSLEGPMLKLKLNTLVTWCEGPIHRKKKSDAGKDWRQKDKGTVEDEMVEWYNQFDKHEFERVLGDGKGQGSRVCCSLWGHKEPDTTEWRSNNNNKVKDIRKILFTIFATFL